MDENLRNSELNQLLINLGRSLLQYVEECGPWTGSDEQNKSVTIENLVDSQRESIDRLTELLIRRRWNIDFGGFPVEYTDLHFVALDYLLSQLVVNQQALVSDIEAVLKICSDDAEATEELKQILSTEQSVLAKLRELADTRTSDSAA